MKSYSDKLNGNDLFVLDVLNRKRGGFFIEAGAMDGLHVSNTYLLEQDYGWRGICVEPDPQLFERLAANRRCVCENICLYDSEGEVEFMSGCRGWGGVTEHLAASKRTKWSAGIPVKSRCTSLANLLKRHNAPAVIDYLSLDTEGTEYHILKDFPFDEYRFNVISIEGTRCNELLSGKGYRLVKNPHNTAAPWEQVFISDALHTSAGERASITAEPNAVPPGPGPGVTTIHWDTGNDAAGAVYVSVDGDEERLFMRGPKGSAKAPWIHTDATYDFRLYQSSGKTKLLASTTVTRSATGKDDPVRTGRNETAESQMVPGLALTRISSYEEYTAHSERLCDELASRRQVERELISNRKVFTVTGWCFPCKRTVGFRVDLSSDPVDGGLMPNLREKLRCPGCKLNSRTRAAIHLLEQEIRPAADSRIYITEQRTPVFKLLRSRYPDLAGSEHLGQALPLGETGKDGVRNEDVTRLTFPHHSFDHVLSFDVFEHVPEYMRGFAECFRVLKPGGKFLFTVPFTARRETDVRAKMAADGAIIHLLPPEIHGDPLNKAGCLCFYNFGWDMVAALNNIGFVHATAVFFWSRELCYLGRGEQALFTAEKPG